MPRAITLVLNAKQSVQKACLLEDPTIDNVRKACANKLRVKPSASSATRFFTETGTELTDDMLPTGVQRVLVSTGEDYIGAGPAIVRPVMVQADVQEPAAQTSASTSANAPAVQTQPIAHDERLQLPNEKGDICWVVVGGGRMALWHKPGGKALPKLAAAGATMVATLLAEREGAELIGRKAHEAGLAWHWADLDGANAEYLASAEAVDVLVGTVATIRSALSRGDSVLVHCSAGLHRTGTVGYAVMRASGWSKDEAREGLRRMREETANKVDEVGAGNAKGGGRLDIVDRLVLDRVALT